MTEEMDKKAVRAYLTRLYRSAKAKDDQYAIGCLNVIKRVLDKLWGEQE